MAGSAPLLSLLVFLRRRYGRMAPDWLAAHQVAAGIMRLAVLTNRAARACLAVMPVVLASMSSVQTLRAHLGAPFVIRRKAGIDVDAARWIPT